MSDYTNLIIQTFDHSSNPKGPTPSKGANGSFFIKKWNDLLNLLSGDIGSNQTNISNNQSAISTNQTNISNNQSAISTNQTNISNNQSAISTNQSNISNNESRITNLENNPPNQGGLTTSEILVKTDNFGSTVEPSEYSNFISQGGSLDPKIIVHHFPFYIPFYYQEADYGNPTVGIRDLSAGGKELIYNDNTLSSGAIFDVDENNTFCDISSVFNQNGEGYYFISLATLDNSGSGSSSFIVLTSSPLDILLDSNNTEGRIQKMSATKNPRYYDATMNYPTSQDGSGFTSTSWSQQWDILVLRDQYAKTHLTLDYVGGSPI